MQLLWRGIAAYIYVHHIDIMFGCASLAGTDPGRYRGRIDLPVSRPFGPRRRFAHVRCRIAWWICGALLPKPLIPVALKPSCRR